MKKKTNYLFLILGLALLLAIPFAGQAAIKKAHDNIYLPTGEVHQGNYYAVGNVIELAGTINGDVFVAGNSITVTGAVNGDIFAAGPSIRVSGQIDGSIRTVGTNISIENKVSRNVMAGGSNIVFTEQAEVGKHLTLAGAVVDVRAKVGGNLEGIGNNIKIANEISGNTNLKLDETGKITLLPQAHLMGNLDYTASDELILEEGAVIEGEINYNPFTKKIPSKKILGLIAAGYFFSKVIQLFGLMVVGLVIISLVRKKVLEISNLMIKKPLNQIGRGLVWFILTPIAAVVLLVTVIGIPLALILTASYVIVLYFCKVFASITLGVMLTKAFGWRKVNLMVSMILGVIVFVIISDLPLVGWLICLVAIWWALGAFVEMKKNAIKEMR